MRTNHEWIGKNDDAAIPRRVRLRVFLKADGQCAICKRKIRPGDTWECDHRIALINGGTNAENNLQVLCCWCHGAKTISDVAEKSQTYKRRSRHYGIRKPKGRPLPGTKASGIRKHMDGRVTRWQARKEG